MFPKGGESFFTSQRGGTEGTYGFPHHGAAMLGGGGTGNDGSVYVTPRSIPRHVEGEACIGEDGSGSSHQVRVHCALLLTGVPIMFVNGII